MDGTKLCDHHHCSAAPTPLRLKNAPSDKTKIHLIMKREREGESMKKTAAAAFQSDRAHSFMFPFFSCLQVHQSQ